MQCPVLEGPYGDRALINVESNVQMTGVAVITTANKYPEATMRWLDYFYSEEGTVLCRLGIEGESYEVVDGKYQLLDNIKNNPDGLTLDQALGQWAIFPGGYLPQYITNEVDQSAAQLPETKAANDVVRDYVVPFEIVPRVKFTEEESIKLGTYASRCIENEILMFLRKNSSQRTEVSFDEPLNTDWDGKELLLSDVLGTEGDVVLRPIEADADRKLLSDAVGMLSQRERAIITMRFGLWGQKELTQKEVADRLGISQSYISRLEKRIILRLRREIVKMS